MKQQPVIGRVEDVIQRSTGRAAISARPPEVAAEKARGRVRRRSTNVPDDFVES
jgi:hypothetical protein